MRGSFGGGDTLSKDGLAGEDPCVESSLIEKMSDEQLVRLINYLFESDNVPTDLAREIQRVADLRTKKNCSSANVFTPVENTRPDIHSCAYYATWDEDHCFPKEDKLTKYDTAFCLKIIGDAEGAFVMPHLGKIASNFGWRDSAMHKGIDIDLRRGDTVRAAFDGVVRMAKREGGFGNVVIIRHYNGLETVYGHLSKIKVKPDQEVCAGQLIGLGGSTGYSTAPHLHFETRFKGEAINPRYFISFEEGKVIGGYFQLKRTSYGIAAFPENAICHVCQKGDSLFEIAKRYAISTRKLRELNNIKGYIRLRPGMKILLSASAQ